MRAWLYGWLDYLDSALIRSHGVEQLYLYKGMDHGNRIASAVLRVYGLQIQDATGLFGGMVQVRVTIFLLLMGDGRMFDSIRLPLERLQKNLLGR
jgi:hypothetical protein